MYERSPGGVQPQDASPGRRVDAKVKWFNATKGFGFVTLSDGSPDAFLPMAVLRRAGYFGFRNVFRWIDAVSAGMFRGVERLVSKVDQERERLSGLRNYCRAAD